MKEIYYTVDNGGKPFKVEVDKSNKTVEIYKQTSIGSYNTRILDVIKDYEHIFIGKDPKYPEFEGQSILIKLDPHNYIYIGYVIYQLHTKDEITSFVSNLGNSNVVYDYGIGNENIYLFIESVFYNRQYFDPYTLYYKHNIEVKKMKKKVLQKRIF